jgi:uncharacterized zinc-type alcohol dehydrogenase-like protein
MAVKIGKAMGAHVTVFSRSDTKREMALKLGATDYVVSTDKEQMAKAKGKFHMLFYSIAFAHNVAPYLATLRVKVDDVTAL